MPEPLFEIELPTGAVLDEKVNQIILESYAAAIWAELDLRSPVDHGYLREHWEIVHLPDKNKILIRNPTAYLAWIISGTGIYGPKHQRITPLRARQMEYLARREQARHNRRAGLHADPVRPPALRWPKAGGIMMFRQSTAGMKPNPFVQESIAAGLKEGERVALERLAALEKGAPS